MKKKELFELANKERDLIEILNLVENTRKDIEHISGKESWFRYKHNSSNPVCRKTIDELKKIRTKLEQEIRQEAHFLGQEISLLYAEVYD